MMQPLFHVHKATLLMLGCCLAAWFMFSGVSRAQTVVLQDEFSSWDSSKWTVYDATRFLQRTQFGNAPTIASESGVTFARFRLDSYNPDPAYRGTYFRGTQANSRTLFQIGSGLEFEARLRGKDLPPGIVFAFFTYSERGVWPSTYLKEEIDYEFLTNFNKNEIWLNIWDDWNPERFGLSQSSRTSAAGLDWSTWNTYKIRWTPTATEWHVNGVLVRRSTDITPKDAMELCFDIWAADDRWTTAYDENLKATTLSAANQSYYMDVDWVRVRTIAGTPTPTPTPTPTQGGPTGNGTGLSATYFDNKDFTGPSLTRIDPQINFAWGAGAPASTMGIDTFSARWTGQVQAQYSETYTFTTNTDDGVRLWVNNQLLVDDWNNHSAQENSGTISLTAGQKYSIRMEYYEDGGGAVAQLFWQSASTSNQLVPRSQLYPVTTTPTDTIRPTVSITTPGSNQTYRSLPTATGSAADNVGVTRVITLLRDVARGLYWNGSLWTSRLTYLPATGTTNWSRTLPPLANGRYAFTARSYDAEGNNTLLTHYFYIDNTPPDTIAPTVNIATPGNYQRYRSLTTATGTAADNVGVTRVTVLVRDITRNLYWNGSAWGSKGVHLPASGTTSWSYTLPPLSDSRYAITARALDAARNSTLKTHAFYIDTVGPQITVTTPRPDTGYSALASATGTAADEAGVASVRGKLWRPDNNTAWNGSAWIAATTLIAAPEIAATGTTSWGFALPALPAAIYLFQAVAQDRLNNATYATPVRFIISGAARLARTQVSDVVLSDAQASGAEVILLFSSELNSEALNPALWQLAVNGEAVAISSVSATAGKMALRLAAKMAPGDAIEVSWPQLRDAQGRLVPGHWQGIAK